MPKNWKTYKLDELGQILNHKRVPLNSIERESRKGQYPYYGASGIVDYIDDFIFEDEHVLISEDGENLRSRQTPIAFKANGKFWVNNHAHIFKGREKWINDFIVYFFQNSDLSPYITGAVQPKLNKDNLLRISIKFQSEESAKQIASILSSLDNKIELNLQMNQTLEAMAQAIFKEWFVNFKFPGSTKKLVDGLPKGWRKCKLKEIIAVNHGFAFKGEFISELENENILLTPGNFKIGGGFNNSKFKYYTGEVPNDYVLAKNDLIVTMTDLSKAGDTLGFSALVPEIPEKQLLHNQRLGKVIINGTGLLKYYLYWVMRQPEYRHFVLGSATGSTVKHTSPSRICDYEVIIPDGGILMQFELLADALVKKDAENTLQSQTLTQLRDSLLPNLMTGKTQVN